MRKFAFLIKRTVKHMTLLEEKETKEDVEEILPKIGVDTTKVIDPIFTIPIAKSGSHEEY
jgi:hypothetical protein